MVLTRRLVWDIAELLIVFSIESAFSSMAILGKIDISISFKSSRILKGSSIYIISDVFTLANCKMMALLMIHLHL